MAEEQESVVEVTAVRVPAEAPLIEAVSSNGAEIIEILLAVPVPAVIFMVMNPTGSVVAFCALASGSVGRRDAATNM